MSEAHSAQSTLCGVRANDTVRARERVMRVLLVQPSRRRWREALSVMASVWVVSCATSTPTPDPATVAQPPGVWSRVSVGPQHTCAVDQQRQAWCWKHREGQPPQRVRAAAAFTQVEPGRRHACALDAQGKAWCWGEQRSTALGERELPPERHTHPAALKTELRFTQIEVALQTSCGLTREGQVWCWGSLPKSLTRDAVRDTESCAKQEREATPRRVLPSVTFTALASVGDDQMCALDTQGTPWCWASYSRTVRVSASPRSSARAGRGLLGRARQVNARTSRTSRRVRVCAIPTRLSTPEPVRQLWASAELVVGLGASGRVLSWGGARRPQYVSDTRRKWRAVLGLREDHEAALCAEDARGRVGCWGEEALLKQGRSGLDLQPRWLDTGGVFTSAALLHDQLCGLDAAHHLSCANTSPSGPRAGRLARLDVAERFERVVGGDAALCGLTTNGQIYCMSGSTSRSFGAWRLDRTFRPAPSAERFRDVAVGEQDICAVTLSGRVMCWGSQLSRWNDRLQNVRASAVTVGYRHACLTAQDGATMCWGSGYLGDSKGGRARIARPSLPADVRLEGLSAGAEHTCGRAHGSGELWCWGRIRLYQRAPRYYSRTFYLKQPERVFAGLTAREVVSGTGFTCVTGDAGVRCFGDGAALGHDDLNSRARPTAPTALDALSEGALRGLTTGYRKRHSSSTRRYTHNNACGIDARGDVLCWGYVRAVHDGPVSSGLPQPRRISASTPMRDVALMGDRLFTLDAQGHLYAPLEYWMAAADRGEDDRFQRITRPEAQRASAGGLSEVCGNGEDDNGDGKVDCDDSACAAQWACVGDPTQLALMEETRLSSPHTRPFGLVLRTRDGRVFEERNLINQARVSAAHDAYHGLKTDPKPAQKPVKKPASKPAVLTSTVASRAATKKLLLGALGTSGTSTLFGSGSGLGSSGGGLRGLGTSGMGVGIGGISRRGSLHTVSAPSREGVALPDRARQVVAGEAHACALLQRGDVWCWGDGRYGQIGDGVPFFTPTPRRVALGERKLVTLTAGARHTCALDTQGQAWCWGEREDGRLGGRAATRSASETMIDPRALPVRVDAPALKTIAAGGQFTCGLTAAGALWCWGERLGTTRSSRRPATLASPKPLVALYAGDVFACGLDAEGAAWCWGDYPGHEPGKEDREEAVTEPQRVQQNTPARFVRLTLGAAHVCGLTRAGEVFCWGDDLFGQTSGRSRAPTREPVQVSFVKRALWLDARGNTTCAIVEVAADDPLKSDKKTRRLCWGARAPEFTFTSRTRPTAGTSSSVQFGKDIDASRLRRCLAQRVSPKARPPRTFSAHLTVECSSYSRYSARVRQINMSSDQAKPFKSCFRYGVAPRCVRRNPGKFEVDVNVSW